MIMSSLPFRNRKHSVHRRRSLTYRRSRRRRPWRREARGDGTHAHHAENLQAPQMRLTLREMSLRG